MLTSLSVNNFTLVESLEVDFSTGMSALTGETGAGKSLVLDALAMALGDRADTDRIREGQERAEVAALFDISQSSEAQHWLAENDFAADNDECLLRRVITREGRSRGYINGQSVTMQQLRELGEMLIDIHSQHEHQSLLRKDSHRQILDAYAGSSELAASVRNSQQQWSRLNQQLQQLTNASDELNARKALLQFQLQEFEELGLAEDELARLEEQQQLLANAESILKDSHALIELCREGDTFNLQDGLNRAVQLLSTMPNKPQGLLEAEKLLNSALIEVEEAGREVQHHLEGFELDPEQLQDIEDRLSAIYQLARKHRIHAEQLPDKQTELQQELDDLTGGAESLETLQQQVDQLMAQYQQQAQALSKQRRAAATQLSAQIEQQFTSLSMKGARFAVELHPGNPDKPSAHGLESVEFLIATNPGTEPKPLSKIASGGELSRISLAIQVIAARHATIPTLVFDEVDVGIGGATANVVGELLRELGNRGQVICVTHQPQVAACAHHQLRVSKQTGQNTAHSDIQPLAEPERIEEIARMLGGASITDTSRDHARELLALANQSS
ncbi:MAG: DNA repair protein RecN [Gammaproteobacteria bacterium]|nr:MAG: DNA repair protein RecN [Gammaproteobacteria bacterium]